MRTAFIILALTVAGALADGFHRHSRNQRQGRRLQQNFRRQGRNRAFRRGRQEEAPAPLGLYGAASETTVAPEVLPPPTEYGANDDYYDDSEALGVYAADDAGL